MKRKNSVKREHFNNPPFTLTFRPTTSNVTWTKLDYPKCHNDISACGLRQCLGLCVAIVRLPHPVPPERSVVETRLECIHRPDDGGSKHTSETSVNFYQTTRCKNPEDSHRIFFCFENYAQECQKNHTTARVSPKWRVAGKMVETKLVPLEKITKGKLQTSLNLENYARGCPNKLTQRRVVENIPLGVGET
jgi:hypothetical protein